MDNIQRLDKIIKDKKWIVNDIGMGRVEYIKAVMINNELSLIISSEVNHRPVWARVERILLENNQLILLYDGQYCMEIDKDEYNRYSEFISNEEWDILDKEDTNARMEEKGLVNKVDTFYVNTHANIRIYEGQYNVEESEKLNRHFNLGNRVFETTR